MNFKRFFELLMAPILAGVVLHLLNAFAIPIITKSEKSISVTISEVTTTNKTNHIVKMFELYGKRGEG